MPRAERKQPGAGAETRLVCRWAAAPLKREARGRAEMTSQVLFGEEATLLEEAATPPGSRERGWLRVRLTHDGYEGYAPREAFDLAPPRPPSHLVRVPQTLLFPRPDIKSAPTQPLYMGARLAVAGEEGRFLKLASGGYVFASHAHALDAPPAGDAAAFAEALLRAPYLWGGRSVAGVDCSGLVQLALTMAGHVDIPRDSGPQSRTLGEALPLAWLDEPRRLRRGDLLFWKGHVAMLLDARTIIHANAHHMMVAREPVNDAIRRIESGGGGAPTALRRP